MAFLRFEDLRVLKLAEKLCDDAYLKSIGRNTKH